MFRKVVFPLTAERRASFVHKIVFERADLTGATFMFQVRDRPGGGGFLRVDLITSTVAGAPGVRLIGVVQASGFPVSTLEIRVPRETMLAADVAADRGEPDQRARAYWDLHIFQNGERWVGASGDFWIEPGVSE